MFCELTPGNAVISQPPARGSLILCESLKQVYLAHKNPSPIHPTVALCLGTYGDPWGVGASYERGTPVTHNLS